MRKFPVFTLLVFACCLIGSLRANDGPVVLGRGQELFEIGPLLAQDDFEDLGDWVVQVQPGKKAPPARVQVRDNTLDCLVPGRGCTVWFKKKLKTRVTISYDVICPTPEKVTKELMPRDINNFWMATDRDDPEGGLFDAERYTGDFGAYNKMNGYYASTGGGKNTTTRMRRYPREVSGTPTAHLALTDKDRKKEFLITPDKKMSVQLVAYDDLIQYIVDGQLVYEAAAGDEIQIETRDGKGKRQFEKAVYDLKKFPTYLEGYFGFRMVGTHHIYSNFRVHALKPPNERVEVKVSTVEELCKEMKKSGQHVVMAPGTYVIEETGGTPSVFLMSGSDNTFDLTDVKSWCRSSLGIH